ncbi:uncharacterized protein EDB93DRAFT_1107596 [Suillus bovinus]|uniref:uncharacterized protein n=1 Tax=Suillus bovinus TaxID=48563 RepID=UPI001B86E31D|nr:uncharacterized protein EDB93DRAFT_1107596 [Suillus bovinus]KAG2133558.1 hypothetical protein EDB93DRAFT_1107596 [Suillus bovinus]
MPSALSKLFKASMINIFPHRRDCHSNDLKTTTVQETGTFRTQLVRQQLEHQPFELIRPPKQLHINPIIGRPYVQYYGYAIPHDWLIRFAERECPEVLLERDHKCYKHHAMVRARELISARSGFWSFDFKYCFNPKDDSVPPLWFEAFMAKYFKSGDDDIRAVQIDTVPVFAVCSEQDESFKERPTQGQMDIMTELIGYAPRWWQLHTPGIMILYYCVIKRDMDSSAGADSCPLLNIS